MIFIAQPQGNGWKTATDPCRYKEKTDGDIARNNFIPAAFLLDAIRWNW